MLWLLGNGHLGGYNVCCFRSSEGKRLWKLKEGGKKPEFPVGRVAKERNLI